MTSTTFTQLFGLAAADEHGFPRIGPEQTRLDALWRLLNNASDPDTPGAAAERAAIDAYNSKRPAKRRVLVPRGFVKGSDAWRDAHALELSLVRTPDPNAQRTPDLFAPQPVARYSVEPDTLHPPLALEDTPPDGYDPAAVDDFDDPDFLWGWDAERVIVACPRGACLIPRPRWSAGSRRCPMC